MLYSLKLLFIALVTIILGSLIIILGLFDFQGKSSYRVSRLWSRIVLSTLGVKVVVKGFERLEQDRPYLFIANHRSYLDVPVLAEGLSAFQLRWIAKRSLAFIPFFGWALWSSKHILVNRASRSETMSILRQARDRLKNGISVVVFPEGTRSRKDLLPFKRGAFLLALRAETPIVPVAIKGTERLLPRDGLKVNSGVVEIVLGAPVPFHKAAKSEEVLDQVRSFIEGELREDATAERKNWKAHEEPLPTVLFCRCT